MYLHTGAKIIELHFIIKSGMFWRPTNIVSFRRDPVYILQEEGWAPGQVCKVSPKPGFHAQTVQHVSNPYTDWDVPARNQIKFSFEFGFVLHIVS